MSTSSDFSSNYSSLNIPFIQVASKEGVIKAAENAGLKNVTNIDDVAANSLGELLVTIQIQELGISNMVQPLSFTKQDPFYKQAFIKLIAEAQLDTSLPGLTKRECLIEMLRPQIIEQLINEEALKEISKTNEYQSPKELAAGEQQEKQVLIPDINQVDKDRFRAPVIAMLKNNNPDLEARYASILDELMEKYSQLSPGTGEYDQLINFINENDKLLPDEKEIKEFVNKYFQLPQKVQEYFQRHIANIEQRGDTKYPAPTSLPDMTRVVVPTKPMRLSQSSFTDVSLNDDYSPLMDLKERDSIASKTFSRQTSQLIAEDLVDVPLRSDRYIKVDSQEDKKDDQGYVALDTPLSNHKWTNVTIATTSIWSRLVTFIENIFIYFVKRHLSYVLPQIKFPLRPLESPVDIHYMEGNTIKLISKKELVDLSKAHLLASTAFPRDEHGKIKLDEGNQANLPSLKIDALHDMLRDQVSLRVGFKLFLEYLKDLKVPQSVRIAQKEHLQNLMRAKKDDVDLPSQILQGADLQEFLDKDQMDKLELSIDKELEELLIKEVESWKVHPEKIQAKSREIKGWMADIITKTTSSADSWLKQVENVEESGSQKLYESEFNKEIAAYDNLRPGTVEYDQFMHFIHSNPALLRTADARMVFARTTDPVARIDAIVSGAIAGKTNANFFEMITGKTAIPADLQDAERLNRLTEQQIRINEILSSYGKASPKKIESAKQLLHQLEPGIYSQIVQRVELYTESHAYTKSQLIEFINQITHREPPFKEASDIFTLYSIIKAYPHVRISNENEPKEVCGIIRDFAKDKIHADKGRNDAKNFVQIFKKLIDFPMAFASTSIWRSADAKNMQCVESYLKPPGEWVKCNEKDIAELAAYYSTVETLPNLEDVENLFGALSTFMKKMSKDLAEAVKLGNPSHEILELRTRLEQCKLGYKNLKAQIEIRSFAKELVDSTETINPIIDGKEETQYVLGDRPIWQHNSGVYMCASEKAAAIAQNWTKVEPWQMYAKIPAYSHLISKEAVETGDPISNELSQVIALFRPDYKLFKQHRINPRQLARLVMDHKFEEILQPLGIIYSGANKDLNTTIKGFVTAYLYLKENGADVATCETLEKIINEHTGRMRAAGQNMR